MHNFKSGKPGDNDLCRAICVDYFLAKHKKPKQNLRKIWKDIVGSYWSVYRSHCCSFEDFLLEMKDVRENLKKNKVIREAEQKKIPNRTVKDPPGRRSEKLKNASKQMRILLFSD